MFNYHSYELVTLVTLFASTGAVVSLFAVWAGFSRLHWFFRILVIELAAALLLPTRVCELVVFFLLQSAVVAVTIVCVRRFRRHPVAAEGNERIAEVWPPRFSLKDIFLATLLVAVLVAISVHVWRHRHPVGLSWISVAATSSCCALTTLATIWLALGSLRPRRFFALRLLSLVLAIAATAMMWVNFDWSGTEFWLVTPFVVAPSDRLDFIQLCVVSSVTYAAILLLLLLLWRASKLPVFYLSEEAPSVPGEPTARRRTHMKRWAARLGLAMLAASVLFPSASLYWKMAQPLTPIPDQEVPEPNAYTEIIQAGRALPPGTVPDPDTATMATMTTFLRTQAPLLQEVRVALGKPTCVPLDYSPTDPSRFATPMIQQMHELGWAFLVEATVAEKEERFADAADGCINVVVLGNHVANGGLVTDCVVGIAIEGLGNARLRQFRDKLQPNDCQRLIRRLETLDADRETAEGIFQRDEAWSERAFGWHCRFALIVELIVGQQLGVVDDRLLTLTWALERRDAQHRLLMTELAIRAYRLEKGANPERLEELVPEYLARVPIDPYSDSGAPLVYRRTNGEYLLYSLGPNREDDGGQRLSWDAVVLKERGDVFVDTKPVWDEEPEDENGEEEEEQKDAAAAP